MAFLKVSNNILLPVDSAECYIWILLDLSAVFHTVMDHVILFVSLKSWVGVTDLDLKWFAPYPTNRTLSVTIGNSAFSTAVITCGVPQGSSLGLFTKYKRALFQSSSTLFTTFVLSNVLCFHHV